MQKLPQINRKKGKYIYKSKILQSNIEIQFKLRFKKLETIGFHYIAR